ncbi:hypothetical protein EDB19DRAFT_1840536 [Suillus lakei]|nr:hypothetical protein EDB19DRAFT_1840536 [Suillus lakei]
MTYMCLVRMKPGRDERTYNNPLMDCSSMGESKTIHITFEDLDVLSAHDRLGDGNGLKAVHFQTEGDHRSLDLGFPASDDDRITDTRNHPQPDILDMQFPTMSDDEQSHDEMLELGFPPESDVEDVLDLGRNTDGALEMGFDIDVSDPAGHTDGALEMGFDTNDIMPDDNPLEMGFDVDPAQFDPDQSFAVIRPDPIGFVIQRAVGDLRIAMHRLDMDRASNAMSPDEAIARQQVLDSTQELLLACQLISISRLAT